MRNKRFINKTGYTKGASTSNNPVNIIPSQDITMRNVPYPLQATPLDQYGNPIGQSTMMMPNEDYFFENASFVEERPIMQMGGWQNPFGQGYSTEENPIMYQDPILGQNTLGNINSPRLPQLTNAFQPIQQQAENNMAKMDYGLSTGVEEEQNNGKPLYQFTNNYGGQDFGSSLFNLGQSIGNEDALGTGVFAGLTALKGVGTFAQGLGSAKKSNQQQKSFYENFRQNMVGNSTYLQDGGEANAGQEQQLMAQVAEALQAGAPPEEILAKLVELGFPEQEAEQIIQSIMQQTQGQQASQEEAPVMQAGGSFGFGAINQRSKNQMTPQEWEYVQSKMQLIPDKVPNKDLDPTNPTTKYHTSILDSWDIVNKNLNDFRTGKITDNSKLPAMTQNNYVVGANGQQSAGYFNPKTNSFDYANPQFANGGTMGQKEQAAVDAGIAEAPIPEKLSNAEIEKGEYIFDSKGIRKALGETHEKDGTPVNLEPNTKVLSDHLKIGDASKELSEKLGKKLKPTLTYAKALDVYNKESGIDDINDEIIKLTAQLEKEQEGKDEVTSSLNIEFLIGKIKEKTDEKRPIEKEQQKMFDVLFGLQEQSKSGEEVDDEEKEFKNGGEMKMLQEISEKYNIPLENLQKALPKYQAGGTANVSVNNTNSVFTNQPAATDWLPYTPVENSTNPLWMGENYATQWVPLVEKSLATPEGAKKIEDWLLSNKQYGENIGYQLKGLTGVDRVNRIKQLATDSKPGPFHNAFLGAVKATVPPIQLNEVVITPEKKVVNTVPTYKGNGEQETIMSTLNMPTRINNMPSWDPSLKVSTRLNRIDPALISPEQQLAETDRAIQSAQQDLQNLSPAMRAVAAIGLTANQISSNNKVVQESNRFNSQATNQADIYNNKISDQEQMAENQNALSYEARILTGKGRYENDLQNLNNQQFRDQTEKWRNVMLYNANNSLNPDVQFDGNKYNVYKPDLATLLGNLTPEQISQAKKLLDEKQKTTTKKKMGGRFKK